MDNDVMRMHSDRLRKPARHGPVRDGQLQIEKVPRCGHGMDRDRQGKGYGSRSSWRHA